METKWEATKSWGRVLRREWKALAEFAVAVAVVAAMAWLIIPTVLGL